jgi:hypothetical protein
VCLMSTFGSTGSEPSPTRPRPSRRNACWIIRWGRQNHKKNSENDRVQPSHGEPAPWPKALATVALEHAVDAGFGRNDELKAKAICKVWISGIQKYPHRDPKFS